jgi:radical SAM protein with 4Fe4S-binding SPASM domain
LYELSLLIVSSCLNQVSKISRIMRRNIKQGLLHFGGYGVMQNLHAHLEHHRLVNSVRRFLDTGEVPLPNGVVLEPTQRCNLRCKMCHQDRVALSKQGELTLEQIVAFFNRNTQLKKISLIGGEIFVRRDIVAVIRHLNRNRDIVLSTNGTLVGNSEIETLRNCKRVFTVCISLDGTRAVHDSIRGVDGAYDRAIRTIEGLAPFLPVTVNCVILNENLECLTEVVNICASMGVKKIKLELERKFPEGVIDQTLDEFKLQSDELPIASKERAETYCLNTLRDRLVECRDQGKKQGIYVTFDPPYLMDEIEACCSGNIRTKKKCICDNLRRAVIAPNGDLVHCFIIRKIFGNILHDSFDEIWNSETANRFRLPLLQNNLTPLCERCPSMVLC